MAKKTAKRDPAKKSPADNSDPVEAPVLAQRFAMTANHPPEIIPPAPVNAHPGVPVHAGFSASDPDGDALTFSVYQPPPPDGVTVHPNGWVEYVPTWQQLAQGTVNIRVQVSDGTDIDWGTWVVNIVDQYPEILPTPTPLQARVDQLFQLFLQATDAENDTLVWSKESGPPEAEIHPQTGLLSWTPDASYANQLVNVMVRVREVENTNATTVHTCSIQVLP